jgi:hypothetical protein
VGGSWVAASTGGRSVDRIFAPFEPSASIKVREPVNEFRNLYLLAGLRGAFERRPSIDPDLAESALLHTLQDRWGLPAPWGACDSGADLDTPGDGVLRGWCHVDLRLDDESPHPNDVPLAGLLRTMWDALELFGSSTLTGVDAILPLDCVGERMWQRVASSATFHGFASEHQVRVVVQLAESYPDAPPLQFDLEEMVAELSESVEVGAAMGDVPLASYPDFVAEHPFGPAPWAAANPNPFRVELAIQAWSIDDAAWLAELVAVACARTGCVDDVEIALRRAT